MPTPPHAPSLPDCDGFSLIESLLALTMLAIMVAGLMQVQFGAVLGTRGAWQHQEAVLILRDLTGRWQLNREAGPAYHAALQLPLASVAGEDTCLDTPCAGDPRARADVAAVAQALSRRLPRPRWRVEPCLDHPGQCLLLAWAGTEASSGPEGGCLDAAGQRHPGASCLVMVLP